MKPRISPYFALALVFLPGCPQVWPDFVTCEEQNACGTTELGSTEPTSTDGGTPTTSEGMNMGDSSGDSSSGPPDGESGVESIGTTTDEPAELPLILTRKVDPDYTSVNAMLDVLVTADHADGVLMKLENGEVTELTPLGPGEFGGQIKAFSGLDNGQKTAWFSPWREGIIGETVGADYVIALPPPGDEVSWQPDLGVDGDIAAIGVLPDGSAEFQDSCRLAIQACLALDFEHPLSYSGLRQTTRTGCQLRVFPDQRSGWRWRAAS